MSDHVTSGPPGQACRLACVRFLNTLPLIEGLEKVRGLELIRAAPARIGAMVADGRADIGLASIVDAATSSKPLALIAVGMIGCDGPTLTVRVFSRIPLEEVRVLWTDSESHTSVVLARLLLGEIAGRRVEAAAYDAARSGGPWPETVLLIGDKVVTDAPPAHDYPHQLDLGQAWRERTGLPFVYATWMCLAERAEDPVVRLGAALLDRQRRHNATRLAWVADRHAEERGWPRDVARRYVGELLRYDVDARAREGATRFLREAMDAGLLPRADVHWAGSEAAASA